MLNMRNLFAALAIVGSQSTVAQVDDKIPYLALGLDAGYFQPIGFWAYHRDARNIRLLDIGPLFQGELELRLKQVGVAVGGSYSPLSTGAWQNYASARGNRIEASASFTQLGGWLRFYPHEDEADAFSFDFGLHYAMPEGQEKNAAGVYDYDFLKSRLGFSAGVGYYRRLNNAIAMAFKIGVVFVPSGAAYADGTKLDVTGLPITVGLRFGGSRASSSRGTMAEAPPDEIVEIVAAPRQDTTSAHEDTARFAAGLVAQGDTGTAAPMKLVSEQASTPTQTTVDPSVSRTRFFFFAFDDFQPDLRLPQVQSVLDEVLQDVRQYPNSRIEIKGHADDLGDSTYNIRLSERRAQAVKEELIRRGIPAWQIHATGFGAERPLQSNDTPEGRMKNRRVEVELVYHE